MVDRIAEWLLGTKVNPSAENAVEAIVFDMGSQRKQRLEDERKQCLASVSVCVYR